MKIKMTKANITMSISIFMVCIILVAVSLIQFKTVKQVNVSDIEHMEETQLREELASWKSKYEEINEKLADTNQKIEEYTSKIESNEEASELLDEELNKSRLLLGLTDVTGDGVVITLTDNDSEKITATDIVELVNELRYAGAEAISVNGVRVVNMTEFADIYGYIIMKPSQRITSPYVIKAIGSQTQLINTLSIKETGFIDYRTSQGKTVKLEKQRNIKIPKYTGEIEVRYMKEVED